MNRRTFLTSALKAGAAGLLVPEWLLDYRGRSQVAVPAMSRLHVIEGKTLDALMQMAVDLASVENLDYSVAVSVIRRGLEGEAHFIVHDWRNYEHRKGSLFHHVPNVQGDNESLSPRVLTGDVAFHPRREQGDIPGRRTRSHPDALPYANESIK